MPYYSNVYRTTDGEEQHIATVVGDQVFGPEADKVKKALIEGGWPLRKPHWVLNSPYFYATKPIEGNPFE